MYWYLLKKNTIPKILEANSEQWLKDYLSDVKNKTKKYRYRHPHIKETLKNETSEKCIYCESKIGHNTPGDIEHKYPVSKYPELIFTWKNLTIACTECNRRKNDFIEKDGHSFIDPYSDSPEVLILHRGPFVTWPVGNKKAEITVKILELDSNNRIELIKRKIQWLQLIDQILERFNSENDPVLKEVLKIDLINHTKINAEYSSMTATYLKTKGFPLS